MDRDAILRDYTNLRRKGIPLSTALVKTLSKEEIESAARDLGMLKSGTIMMETEDEIAVIMDYAIHEIRHEGRNAVDRFLIEQPPPEGSDEGRLLRSLQGSHFTVLEIERTVPGLGVHAWDGPAKVPTFVVDVGFSHTATIGMSMAVRLHSPGEGWWMTTGAAMPITAEAREALVRDLEEQASHQPTDLDERDLCAVILRACLEAGASHSVQYAPTGENMSGRSQGSQFRRAARVGRNDPCPCGSGKKFKKCCGA